MNNAHSVLKNKEHGTYTVLSQNSAAYIDLYRSGKYDEVYTGRKKECDDWVEENTTSDMYTDD